MIQFLSYHHSSDNSWEGSIFSIFKWSSYVSFSGKLFLLISLLSMRFVAFFLGTIFPLPLLSYVPVLKMVRLCIQKSGLVQYSISGLFSMVEWRCIYILVPLPFSINSFLPVLSSVKFHWILSSPLYSSYIMYWRSSTLKLTKSCRIQFGVQRAQKPFALVLCRMIQLHIIKSTRALQNWLSPSPESLPLTHSMTDIVDIMNIDLLL